MQTFKLLSFPQNLVKKIIQTLQKGGVVLMPFDTSYGLVCDTSNLQAVKKIYQIKKRPLNKPLSVVMRDLEMIKKYAKLSPWQEKILKEKLPGCFTFVLELKKNHPLIYPAPQLPTTTLAIRIPDFELIQQVSQKFSQPYTATSANLSGKPNCYSLQEVFKQIGEHKNLIDLAIDTGKLPAILPSAIIDLTSKKMTILRK